MSFDTGDAAVVKPSLFAALPVRLVYATGPVPDHTQLNWTTVDLVRCRLFDKFSISKARKRPMALFATIIIGTIVNA